MEVRKQKKLLKPLALSSFLVNAEDIKASLENTASSSASFVLNVETKGFKGMSTKQLARGIKAKANANNNSQIMAWKTASCLAPAIFAISLKITQ